MDSLGTFDIAEAELIWPGVWIDDGEANAVAQLTSLLHMLDSAFAEAVLALLMFAGTRDEAADVDHREAWRRDSAERHAAEKAAWQGRPDPWTSGDWAASRQLMSERRIEGERMLVRHRWEAGRLPTGVEHQLPFIYARAFLFALDNIARILRSVSVFPIQTAAAEAEADLINAIPGLRGVRDTAHHPEDRARGVDRRGRRIDLKPISNGGIHAPAGGVLVLNQLTGTRYGCTTEAGTFEEVDVVPATLLAARDAIQKVLDSIPWRPEGEPRRSPSA